MISASTSAPRSAVAARPPNPREPALAPRVSRKEPDTVLASMLQLAAALRSRNCLHRARAWKVYRGQRRRPHARRTDHVERCRANRGGPIARGYPDRARTFLI